MIVGSWVCLLAPLAGALLITLAGTHISRSTAAWISTGSVFVGFGGAVVAFIQVAGETAEERSHLSTAYTWLGIGRFEVRPFEKESAALRQVEHDQHEQDDEHPGAEQILDGVVGVEGNPVQRDAVEVFKLLDLDAVRIVGTNVV